ncbi:MAG: fatty acid oxidation complex subunit alpha FadB [Rhodobacteraceae bacterium]|nr:fatty acid oxidation complex subunit alpha FadB [Paracoccaceae bacterium]MAY47824.1 fatty acid oxidation complex subunit alpha FadB [Paracoccaceae bacterium]
MTATDTLTDRRTLFTGRDLTLTLTDGVAMMTIDQPGAPFNTVGRTLHGELADCVALLTGRTDVTALVVTSGKTDFVVGADITEFGALFAKDAGGIFATNAPLNAGYCALEDLPVPVVAAVCGMALGGGLELALCADARVLSDDAALGLPEVKLGLIPGLGGTVRLPRLAGIEESLAMIASGAPIRAEKAVDIGVAEKAVTRDAVVPAAIAHAKTLAADPEGWKAARAARKGPVPGHESVDFDALSKQVAKRAPKGQPAIATVVDLLRRGAPVDRDVALEMEGRTFAEIAKTQAANALTGSFFAERKVRKLAAKAADGAPKIAHVLVLGAGIMGGGIAWACARSGMDVRIKDIAQPALDKALEEASRIAAREISRGRFTQAKAEEVLGRIHPQLDDTGVETADLVIEAVIEKLEIKRAVLADLEPKLKAQAVIATNTSSLRVRDIAQALKDPSRLVGMHFFNPVPVMPLVEIVRAPQTAPAAVALAVRCGLDLRKTPIVVDDCPGFLVNRILTAYCNAFCRLVAEGVDFRAIDAAMEGWGWPMGPAWLEDVVGMDTGAHVIEVISAGYPERMTANYTDIVGEMAKAGRLGQKSGEGFYRYARNAEGRMEKQPSNTVDAVIARVTGERNRDMTAEEIVERLMVPTLVEAIMALEEGAVGTAEELDQALLLGIGFPAYAGGCLRYADWLGTQALVAACDRLELEVGPSCAAPESLRRMAEAGGAFYI